MKIKQVVLIALVCVIVGIFLMTDAQQWISLDVFREVVANNPYKAALLFFGLYVVVAATSIPGAVPLTLIAGAVFGLYWGVVIVSFASTLGATLSMLVSRFLLREWVQKRFSESLRKINREVDRQGSSYLFTLRLIPVVPFVVINLVFGLMPISAWRFYWVSQVGMLAGTAVYVNAGAQLGAVDTLSVSGILTWPILLSFVLLASFPYLVKRLLPIFRRLFSNIQYCRRAKKYAAQFSKPSEFDCNLVVIGAGSGGLVSAYIAAAVKSKVILIEKHAMGGDCLNTGCVPSKALIHCAAQAHKVKHGAVYGVNTGNMDIDFKLVMAHVKGAITKVEPHDSVERYTKLGVECVQGEAEVLSPWEVKVGERTIRAKNMIIASGASPFMPPIPGIEKVDAINSDTLWSMEERPERLLIMGAGPIGCEMAQAFSRLGSQVTIVDKSSRIMAREDEAVSLLVDEVFEKEGITRLLNSTVKEFGVDDGERYAIASSDAGDKKVVFDKILVAVGRKANIHGFGLEKLDLEITDDGRLVVDAYQRTKYANIFACGDVAGPYQFTHVAAHQAWYAAVNALFGRFKRFEVDYRVIPWAIFTDPEVARVGLSESEANAQGVAFEVTQYGIGDLDRAITEGADRGFVKVLTKAGSDQVIGATIVGSHAAELITEFVTAMKHNIGLNKILGTIHLYPSWSEANKYAAGEWKRAHAPEGLLRWVEKYHRWMRT